jgi:hypothetical protein
LRARRPFGQVSKYPSPGQGGVIFPGDQHGILRNLPIARLAPRDRAIKHLSAIVRKSSASSALSDSFVTRPDAEPTDQSVKHTDYCAGLQSECRRLGPIPGLRALHRARALKCGNSIAGPPPPGSHRCSIGSQIAGTSGAGCAASKPSAFHAKTSTKSLRFSLPMPRSIRRGDGATRPSRLSGGQCSRSARLPLPNF